MEILRDLGDDSPIQPTRLGAEPIPHRLRRRWGAELVPDGLRDQDAPEESWENVLKVDERE